MAISDAARSLLTLCAIRVEGKSPDWSLLARSALAGRLDALLDGAIEGAASAKERKSQDLLRAGLTDLRDPRARVDQELEAAAAVGAHLVTVLDDDYPANLRLVHDLPPFLFIRGTLRLEDLRAVAVVGTRQVSDLGVARAARMSRELVAAGVTVTSGLARGVDTAAHTAALDAGGRTVAVMGTGITRCYPAENKALAERITTAGALVSQFWPTRPPGRDTFPRRNRVTSGISQGTVVIEASSTSGAKMQARLAAEHGKRVWLIKSLVQEQDWAATMVADGRAREVASTQDVIVDLRAAGEIQQDQALRAAVPRDAEPPQLALDFG